MGQLDEFKVNLTSMCLFTIQNILFALNLYFRLNSLKIKFNNRLSFFNCRKIFQ